MKLTSIAVFELLMLVALPASAYHCPVDMEKIDQALASTQGLNTQQVERVRMLRHEGELHHRSGDHVKSVEVLGRALQILNIE